MLHNYAWIVERSGPPNENWRLVNSITDITWFRRRHPDPAAEPSLYFEFGSEGKHRSIEVNYGRLSHLFLSVDVWLRDLPGGPVYVYGQRNLFEPLLAHWRKARGQAVHPSMIDILENLILPGAAPTVEMRDNVDRQFAWWMTGENVDAPREFVSKLCPPLPPP